jgi:hypothetical protein
VPKRNMDDVMGLTVGSFAEDESCSWVKSTVLQWCDHDTGVLELVRYVGCLPLALGLASAHARVHGTPSPTEFLAALKRAVPPPLQLEVGAKVSLSARARLAKFDHQKPATLFIGRRYSAHAVLIYSGSCVAGRGTLGSRSGRGWWRRGAGRDESAGRLAGNVQFDGQFLERRRYLRDTRQVRGGAGIAQDIARYQDPQPGGGGVGFPLRGGVWAE